MRARFEVAATGSWLAFLRDGARIVGRRTAEGAAAPDACIRLETAFLASGAAAQLADAALAGETTAQLAARICNIARALTGAAGATVHVRAATGLQRLGADGKACARELADRALASGEWSGPTTRRPSRCGWATSWWARSPSQTPLTSIKGFSYSIARRLEEGEPCDPRHVRVLERQAERLHSLLEEMLEVSRVETGRFVLHQEPCEMAELVEAAQRSLRRLGADDVSAEIEPSLSLLADRERFERALCAMVLRPPAGAGHSRGTAARRAGHAARLVVGGADGRAERARALLPQWESPQPQRQGLGMALTIAHRAAEQHHGSMGVEPNAFVLDLPLRKSELEADAGAAELRRQQGELGRRQARADGDEQRELSRAQEALGREQEKIGREQEKLGKQQEKLGKELQRKVAQLIEVSLQDGTTKQMD